MDFNFDIHSTGAVSSEFLERSIKNFNDASRFVASLPYARNKNKSDILTVFKDQCGTCSTKHAVLKRLSEENNKGELRLFLGIFKMSSNNTQKVQTTLEKYNLKYIPEAHNYLKVGSAILDFTNLNSEAADFSDDIIQEQEIEVLQITDYKVRIHKEFLEKWLLENPSLNYSSGEIWKIREECIAALSS